MLREKELLDQRIKELTQKFSEERVYANEQLSEKNAQIESLETEVSELLAKLGRAHELDLILLATHLLRFLKIQFEHFFHLAAH